MVFLTVNGVYNYTGYRCAPGKSDSTWKKRVGGMSSPDPGVGDYMGVEDDVKLGVVSVDVCDG